MKAAPRSWRSQRSSRGAGAGWSIKVTGTPARSNTAVSKSPHKPPATGLTEYMRALVITMQSPSLRDVTPGHVAGFPPIVGVEGGGGMSADEGGRDLVDRRVAH